MPDQPPPPPGDEPPANPPPVGDEPQMQKFQPVSARVPERVARGVYSTGQIILDGPKEFIVDFLQGLTRPQQVVARVVMTPATAGEFAAALRQNLDNYARHFGPPTPLPPPGPNRPTVQEIYENFKLADDMLSGVYANAVLIGHSLTEFFFDFITAFYPTSAVSARVYMPAPMAPRFLASLENSIRQSQLRQASAFRQGNPPSEPGEGSETP